MAINERENEPAAGVLYVVATPVGNLEDVTLRALKILGGADWVAAEDTRRTRTLMEKYGLKSRLISLSGDAERGKAGRLVDRLEAGERGAVVSDAGTPGASDPGGRLVAEAVERGVAVSPVPGVSAITAALSVSGLASSRFVFEGFPPRGGGKRRARLEELGRDERPVMIFESALRVEATLKEIYGVWGDRRVTLFRELTKVHEEIMRTRLSEIAAGGVNLKKIGEYTIIIEGGRASEDGGDAVPDAEVERIARELSRLDAPPGNLAAALARIAGIPRNQAYRILECVRKSPLD